MTNRVIFVSYDNIKHLIMAIESIFEDIIQNEAFTPQPEDVIEIIDILEEDEGIVVQCLVNGKDKDINLGEKEEVAKQLGTPKEWKEGIDEIDVHPDRAPIEQHYADWFVGDTFFDEWIPTEEQAIKLIRKVTDLS